ncbi:hypothetical protein K6Q96_21735 [Grimontia kaedaensis]|uniref:DUF3592 domain-containing protein n=1 Tax=Grimontia kaedaensis TaxID=2872157 RepID=A0ABY4WZG4_9GAMM|nr:hypothetical protein [Grimontia kaedaensis]USH04361.1 hypothetical protein K6Q96_21735 [Grimontia kaedaensis]
MGLIIVSLVVGVVVSYLIFSVPKDKRSPLWFGASIVLVMGIAVCSYPLATPHILVSDYLPIEQCETTDYELRDYRTPKNTNVLDLAKSQQSFSMTIEGGLGYWAGDRNQLEAGKGQTVSITQCPYFGYPQLSNMVAQVAFADNVIYQYRTQAEFEEQANTDKLFGFIGFPLFLLLLIVLNIYLRRDD